MMPIGYIVCGLAVGLTLTQWAVAGLAWFRRARARRIGTSRASRSQPTCAVIIPSKGAPAQLEGNLRAHLQLDYPAYRVIVAVESTEDPGFVMLQTLAQEDARLTVVVAGLATAGCQQNHNMIAGVEVAGSVDILAFADNDYAPSREWLGRLVAPLADPAITVTSGYRWLILPPGARGAAAVQVAMNMAMYMHFAALNQLVGRGLWGGAFALRREDFGPLEVARLWRDSISDDMTLAAALVSRHRRSHLVPELLIESNDVERDVGAAVGWYRRQILNVRLYDFPTWIGFMIPGYVIASLLLVWPLVAWIGASVGDASWWAWGGAAGGVYLAGEMVTAAMVTRCGPVRHRGWFVFGAPWWRVFQTWGALKSAGRRVVHWAGVNYELSSGGKVVRIGRDGP